MNSDKNTPSSWWEESWVIIEMIVCALGTVWLSLSGLSYGATVVGTWQSCTAGSGVDCTPWRAVVLAAVVLVGVVILSCKQPTFMRFVGAMFFGLFLAGFCGIIGLFESVYPWWIHVSILIVGVVGASVLLPDDKFDEILEGRTKKATILDEILEC
jgi:hypothetical protein